MNELLIAFALFCSKESILVKDHDLCNKAVSCYLKELEGPIGKSLNKNNQEIAVEKCTREIMCNGQNCSKNTSY